MKKPLKQVRLEPDVERMARKAAKDIGRTLQEEVNRSLRNIYEPAYTFFAKNPVLSVGEAIDGTRLGGVKPNKK